MKTNFKQVLKVAAFILLAAALVVTSAACGKKDKTNRVGGYNPGGYYPPGTPGGPGTGGQLITRAVGMDDRYSPTIVLQADVYSVDGSGSVLGQVGIAGQLSFPGMPYGCNAFKAIGPGGITVSGTGSLISGMQIGNGPAGPITMYGRVTSSARFDVTIDDGTGYCNAILN